MAYIAVLGYLATRALRQVPRGTSAGSLPGGLLDTRIVYNTKTGTCQPPLPAELIDTPDGSFDVWSMAQRSPRRRHFAPLHFPTSDRRKKKDFYDILLPPPYPLTPQHIFLRTTRSGCLYCYQHITIDLHLSLLLIMSPTKPRKASFPLLSIFSFSIIYYARYHTTLIGRDLTSFIVYHITCVSIYMIYNRCVWTLWTNARHSLLTISIYNCWTFSFFSPGAIERKAKRIGLFGRDKKKGKILKKKKQTNNKTNKHIPFLPRVPLYTQRKIACSTKEPSSTSQ